MVEEKSTLNSLLSFFRKEKVSAWKDGIRYTGDDAMNVIYTAFGVREMTRWERVKHYFRKIFRVSREPKQAKKEEVITPYNVGVYLERKYQFVMLNHPTKRLYQKGFIQIEATDSNLLISNGMSDKSTRIGINKKEIETAIKYFGRI